MGLKQTSSATTKPDTQCSSSGRLFALLRFALWPFFYKGAALVGRLSASFPRRYNRTAKYRLSALKKESTYNRVITGKRIMDLWTAVKNNDLVSARSILKDSQGDGVNASDDSGRTPLFWAAKGGDIKVAQLLLDSGAQDSINTPDNQGVTPIFWPAYKGDIEMVQFLLDNGAKDSVNTSNLYGKTPLYMAVCNNYIEMAQLLLDNGAKITGKTMSIAVGDMKSLLKSHMRMRAKAGVTACLLSVQRRIDTLAGNPDNASYDNSALSGGLIPALIFSCLSTPVTNNENQEGANVKVWEHASVDAKRPRHET